jgi:hypothetical protein
MLWDIEGVGSFKSLLLAIMLDIILSSEALKYSKHALVLLKWGHSPARQRDIKGKKSHPN